MTQASDKKSSVQHQTLCKFIRETLKAKNPQTWLALIQELDCYTKYKPDSIRKWYEALSDCVECLALNQNRDLKNVIFNRFRWDFPFETLQAYCLFCCNLISSDATYINAVLTSCIQNFTENIDANKCPPKIEINEENRFGMIHQLLSRLHAQRPGIPDKILQNISHHFPKMHRIRNDNECILTFINQIFRVMDYIPELKDQLLQLIIERMIMIDTEANKIDENLEKLQNMEETKIQDSNDAAYDTNDTQQIKTEMKTIDSHNEEEGKDGDYDSDISSEFSSAEDESDNENGNDNDIDIDTDMTYENKTINSDVKDEKLDEIKIDEDNLTLSHLKELNPMAYIMDRLMIKIFEYMDQIDNDNNIKSMNHLFNTFCRIFERSILSTMECHHVQYTMFYLCHFRPSFSEGFVQRLLRVCTDTRVPQNERCFAAAYVGGFVSKAKYIRNATCLSTFELLLQWSIAYIDLYNRNYPFLHTIGTRESQKHPLFFSACQALFRIYSHHQNIIEMKWKTHSKVAEMYKLVKSPLQPIKFCDSELVSEFLSCAMKSKFIDIKLFPQSSDYYDSKSFATMQVCPFDDYKLPVSMKYLMPLFKIHDNDINHEIYNDNDNNNNNNVNIKNEYDSENETILNNNNEMTDDCNEDEIENDTFMWANKIDPAMALTPTVSAQKSPNIDTNYDNYELDTFELDDDIEI